MASSSGTASPERGKELRKFPPTAARKQILTNEAKSSMRTKEIIVQADAKANRPMKIQALILQSQEVIDTS